MVSFALAFPKSVYQTAQAVVQLSVCGTSANASCGTSIFLGSFAPVGAVVVCGWLCIAIYFLINKKQVAVSNYLNLLYLNQSVQ